MRRRRLAWLVGLGAVGVGAALAYWALDQAAPRPPLQTQNFGSVRAGLTQAEVERLLGGPPGNYGRYANGRGMMTEEGYLAPPGSVEEIWCDDSNRFEIYFDAQGRVVGQHKRAGYRQEPPEWPLAGWWRMVRRQLGV
jgi:hypothetical protein